MPITGMSTLLTQLAETNAPAVAWLRAALDGTGFESEIGVRTTFAQAARKFGEAIVASAPPGLTATDVARWVILLEAFARRPTDEHAGLALRLFHGGELGEQVSMLRLLPHLPEPARFVDLAREATRTNVVPVFEALACASDYPARWLPDDALRQLVLKAIFLDVSVAQIRGLAPRVDAELARMLEDYAAERRAAGRVVPGDVAWTLALMEKRP